MTPMTSTLGDMIRARAAEGPDRPAITYEGVTITYAELDARASRVASGLLDIGIRPGDRIAFLDKNGPAYFELLLGAAKAGIVTVAVNWRLAPREMAFVIRDATARVLVVGSEFTPMLPEILRDASDVEKVLAIGDPERPDPERPDHESFDAWGARQRPTDPMVPTSVDDVAMQVYTSGTTGLPKGAMLPHRNLFALAPYFSDELGFGPDSVSLVVMPVFHVAGAGWGLVGLFNGAHNVLHRDVDLGLILDAIPRYRVTHTLFVPAVMQLLLATPGVEDTDFSSLRAVVYGASPISRELLARVIERFGCEFTQAYGLTETTGAVVMLPAADHDPDGPHPERLRAAGVAMPGVELRIADPATGAERAPETVGEVWIRSAQVMVGYWHQPEETARAVDADGWFRSGDAGYLDAHGYLFISDRVKDMVITGGENVYPAEVEHVLMEHPDVADVAVIGVPDERWGETVKAVVVRRAGSAMTESDLIAFARERLAAYKCPTSVDWADVLPRNPSGKILKRDLRAPYWRDQDRGVH
ncbi:MAG: long-chain-fatty-acid--CoA ligase [Acidimicrobiia bacterium]